MGTSDLRKRLESFVAIAREKELSEGEKGNGNNDRHNTSSFEETGFNIIKMIKAHLSHSEPLMYHVVAHYHQFRRNSVNRFFFWVLAYIGQIIDMIFSALYGALMLIIAIIVVIAIARGIGIGDFLIDIITAIR